jgi:hypothetical protein
MIYERVIKDYKCSDCGAVYDRPGPCAKCAYGWRRPVVIELPAELDIIVLPDDPPKHANCKSTIVMPDEVSPVHACTCDAYQDCNLHGGPCSYTGPQDVLGPHGPGCTHRWL